MYLGKDSCDVQGTMENIRCMCVLPISILLATRKKNVRNGSAFMTGLPIC